MTSAAGPSIVFLNRFYWPDEAATAQMLTDLAEDLAAAGWRVTVIASNGSYREGHGASLPALERHAGVDIVRVPMTSFARKGLAGRALDYAAYVVGTIWRLMRGRRWDAIAVMTDPPLMVAIAVFIARLRGIRCVYWAQDLFPEIAAELDVLRPNSALYRALRWMAHAALARCDLVIAIGDGMARRIIADGAPPNRVAVVHNWTDASAIVPIAPESNPFVAANALDRKFVVLYSGNAGRAHTFSSTIEAARRLSIHPDVVFLFVGGGPRIADLKRAAQSNGGIPSFRFLGHVPRGDLRYSLSAASVSLVTEKASVAGLLVPSKAYGALASGRPLVFVGSDASDVAILVRRHKCGFVVDPADADGLVAVLQRLRNDPRERSELGANARAASREYDRSRATARWASIVQGVIAGATTYQSRGRAPIL